MKKYSYIALTFVIVNLINISCKSILDEEVVSGVTAEYYNTPEGFIKAVDASYVPLRSYYGSEIGEALTVFGTDEYTNGGHGDYQYMNQYTTALNAASPTFWHLWANFYIAINTCNTVISRGGQVAMGESERNARLAEVKFLRAHYYFELVRSFGPIPISLEETIGVQTESVRQPEEDVYKVIIEDLEFAREHLPTVQKDFGRATRPAAENMLALVLLTRGYKSFAKPDDFSRSADLAIGVINNYQHKLLGNPIAAFNHNDERNNEIIWSVQYTEDLLSNGSGNGSHLFYGAWFSSYSGLVDSNQPGYGRPWIRFRPTLYGLENFRPLNVDSRYSLTFQNVWYYNDAKGLPSGAALGDTAIWVTDKQLNQKDVDLIKSRHPSIALFSWNKNNVNDPWYRPINIFPWPEAKFGDYKRVSAFATEGSRDQIVYRLAETYLIVAEALFKDGKVDKAVPYVNAIRKRAAFPGKESQMEISVKDLSIDFILDERARELFGEQKRWHDLVRTGKLVERVKLYNPEAAKNIKEFHALRPIPENQITRTSNKVEQNPGY